MGTGFGPVPHTRGCCCTAPPTPLCRPRTSRAMVSGAIRNAFVDMRLQRASGRRVPLALSWGQCPDPTTPKRRDLVKGSSKMETSFRKMVRRDKTDEGCFLMRTCMMGTNVPISSHA